VAQAPEFLHEPFVEQQAIGEEREDDLRKPARHVENPGRVAARRRNHHQRDAQFVRLADDLLPAAIGQF